MKSEFDIAKEIITKTIGEKPFYTVEDIQKLFGKSRQWVYELVYEGLLVPVEKNHNPRKYTFTLISLIESYIKLTRGVKNG
ncbi:helix-turn-helix domain-containing protein [Hydrogenivirga sp. 128-5-R1-1]|uniref:helix-turn-helix domain-containing protein n=1 Tax=Hydrogenivirga sp. 128-5-R1-1 TaxID=392423 RepID=UPI00015F2EDF|nr:helix-turn-helix domain-containing protein [Hydrogenivirga sp. 128-5-R1-1]EDP73155.1 hypothetical protein HG1285_08241 [Hydrogenivirga sp. 128-5-R1-1]